MKDGQDLDPFVTHAVRHDEWRIRHDQLTGSGDAASAPKMRMNTERLYLISDLRNHSLGGRRIAARQIITDCFKLAQRGTGPRDLHRCAPNFLNTRATSSSVAKSP